LKYDRLRKLFGEQFTIIQNSNIIILGVGGVGGYALDCLYKSGVKNITIIDDDIFEESNQNRQIGSLDGLGKQKVFHLASLYEGITPIFKTIDKNWVENYDFSKYDLILDAIDDIPAKISLITKYHHKLISSGGSAKRIDPTRIKYIDIWQTFNDPFIKKIRTELKKVKFSKKFKIIFSDESPKCTQLGSFVGVTGSFGLCMCYIAIQKIISNYQLK